MGPPHGITELGQTVRKLNLWGGGGSGRMAVDKSASMKACYQLILQNFRQGNLNDFYFQNVCHLDLQLFHLL